MGEYKSETERAAELQEKAISIRDYMQEPGTMKQIMAALPQWLRVDRFIRLFYTAMMKNYKLMDCTKQSLLSCMIEAAQIGLEPVLGKAALIPYKNEVQFQPMYKGLIEVARRFAYISITAHVVYEADRFEMSWGDDEKIIHIADIRNPDREKSAKLGAYDVWRGDDKEIISRRFMPTSQILFIRDTYSKAWQKDGKASVWGKHEDEQFVKTVIKNHCKLEPQCIEMERAVELDDRAEIQRTQLGMGRIDELPMPTAFDFKAPETGDTGTEEQPKGTGQQDGTQASPPADVVKTISAQSGIPVAAIKEFISFIAKRQEKTEQWVEENALKSPESFIRAVRARVETLKKEGEKPKPNGKESEVNEALIKEFWNLRVGHGGKTGLKAYVTQNMKHIYEDYPEAVLAKLKEKFEAFYPGETFPAPFKKQETPPPEETQANGAAGKVAGQSHAEEVGQGIMERHDEEANLLDRYDNSVESAMKFDKSGVKYTIKELESFMLEMAHMEGIAYSSFKADVMRRHQFLDYFDKFIARISGREG
uniref:Putative DNA recombination protein n=1 Tax=viral metagenome TaxID=1070528 RepID=A0A6H1ZDC2_9ZZZZ